MPKGKYPRPPFSATEFHRRFWEKVAKGDGCWEWKGGAPPSTGYGRIYRRGKSIGAHRAAWEISFGPILKGLQVCHKCDNRTCVRPDHLFLGTISDNIKDMVKKGRHRVQSGPENLKKIVATMRIGTAKYYANRTHCKHGHEFSLENTYIAKSGQRVCRECRRLRLRGYRRLGDWAQENQSTMLRMRRLRAARRLLTSEQEEMA